MNNLALTFCALGRLEEALLLQEKVVNFRRRVLPGNHRLIGTPRVFCIRLLVAKQLSSIFSKRVA